MRRCAIIVAMAVGLGGVAQAQDDARAAPEYFIKAIIDASTAQQLAMICPRVKLDLPVVEQVTGDVMARLEQDGFDLNSETLGMVDPGDELVARQRAFMAKHDLDNAEQEDVCAAARAEMAEGSVIGSYLTEVPG